MFRLSKKLSFSIAQLSLLWSVIGEEDRTTHPRDVARLAAHPESIVNPKPRYRRGDAVPAIVEICGPVCGWEPPDDV